MILIVALLLGVDPRQFLDLGDDGGAGAPGPRPAAEDEKASFVAVVLADTEDVWNALFQELGASYQEPHLRLFTGAVNTEGCGFAEAAVGPFYCPADSRIYLDLSFFRALHERLGAPGDFAEAYVIAHEVGHHVQNLLGTSDDIAARRGQATPEVANRLSVRLELQADYLAGVWAHHARAELGVLEGGDVEEAIRAAGSIGDDRLQRESRGWVRPDSFTHGTSEQRVRWFRRGFESGDPSAGDTFGIPYDEL